MVECLEAFHCVLVGVFGQIVDPETKDNVSTFENVHGSHANTKPQDDTKSTYAHP